MFEHIINIVNDEHVANLINNITILIPEKHICESIGRNTSYNYIRKHPELYSNTIWIGSDDDDKIDFNKMRKVRKWILQHIIKTDNIILSQSNQNVTYYPRRIGIKRYASWSYFFSPIYYNNVLYRSFPINKDDLDVFNKLCYNDQILVHLPTELLNPYIYKGYSEHGAYRNDDLFRDPNVIQYYDLSYIVEHNQPNRDTNHYSRHIFPAMNSAERYSKGFYLNIADDYVKFDPRLPRYTRNYCGIRICDAESNELMHSVQNNDDYVMNNINNFENTNGDVYIISYVAYTLSSNLNQTERLHFMFQNGKIPTIDNINSIQQDMDEDDRIINDISMFTNDYFNIRAIDDIKNNWNNRLLTNNQTLTKMFGSSLKSNNYILFIIMFIILVIFIIAIIVCVLHKQSTNQNKYIL